MKGRKEIYYRKTCLIFGLFKLVSSLTMLLFLTVLLGTDIYQYFYLPAYKNTF